MAPAGFRAPLSCHVDTGLPSMRGAWPWTACPRSPRANVATFRL